MRRLAWLVAAGLALGARGLASAETPAEPARPSQALLQTKWVVPDAPAAAVEVVEWVRKKGGLAVRTSERHVSMQLPSDVARELFKRYATAPAPGEAASGSRWITVSLELVSAP